MTAHRGARHVLPQPEIPDVDQLAAFCLAGCGAGSLSRSQRSGFWSVYFSSRNWPVMMMSTVRIEAILPARQASPSLSRARNGEILVDVVKNLRRPLRFIGGQFQLGLQILEVDLVQEIHGASSWKCNPGSTRFTRVALGCRRSSNRRAKAVSTVDFLLFLKSCAVVRATQQSALRCGIRT